VRKQFDRGSPFLALSYDLLWCNAIDKLCRTRAAGFGAPRFEQQVKERVDGMALDCSAH